MTTTTTTTVITTRPAPSVQEDEHLGILDDGDDDWCIERKDNPDLSLCGQELEGVQIPDEEVGDENTCPECLRIRNESL